MGALKMVAVCSSETLASIYQTAFCFHSDMTLESRNSSLLGNGSVNTFPRKLTRATIEERCVFYGHRRFRC
jgi:hypothetical protein